MSDMLKPGDVVQLPSGSPPMTIVKYRQDLGKFECAWFEDGKPRAGFYYPDTLRKAPPPPWTPDGEV